MKRVLVTGSAGFIGSAVVRHLAGEVGVEVLNVDKITYAGNLESLRPVSNLPNYRFARADICDRAALEALFAEFRPDGVMHLAAESHVDRSITGAGEFVQTNIVGTFTLLEAARAHWTGLDAEGKAGFRFLRVKSRAASGPIGALIFCQHQIRRRHGRAHRNRCLRGYPRHAMWVPKSRAGLSRYLISDILI